MLTTTTKQITLCDDIITGTLDYLNPDKAHQKTPQQRLLGTILLYHIVKRLKKPVTLDVTETQIYNDCLSSEIQTLLKTIDFVIPATQQQSRLSIFRNYTSSAYNSLSKKLSEYKLGLMFGSVASAVAIVAAYRYLTSK